MTPDSLLDAAVLTFYARNGGAASHAWGQLQMSQSILEALRARLATSQAALNNWNPLGGRDGLVQDLTLLIRLAEFLELALTITSEGESI